MLTFQALAAFSMGSIVDAIWHRAAVGAPLALTLSAVVTATMAAEAVAIYVRGRTGCPCSLTKQQGPAGVPASKRSGARKAAPNCSHEPGDRAWPAWKAAVIAPSQVSIRGQARSQLPARDRG